MRAANWRDGLLRQSAMESCEQRCLTTVQPLAAPAAALSSAAPDDALPVGSLAGGTIAAGAALASVTTAQASFGLESLASFGLDGAGQTVVIVDSGVAYDHPSLGKGFGAGFHVVGGWDFAENDANPYDDAPGGGHGTHVAGILASVDRAAPGVASGVDLVALRVFDDRADGAFDQIEQALRWVHQRRNDFRHPITTVNLSIGADWNSTVVPNWSKIEDELRTLKDDGIFVSAAAGNGFAGDPQIGLSYPAASPSVVPVASVDANGQLSSFSQRSPRVLAAPGRDIRSTLPDYLGNFNRKTDDFGVLSGTSMAAPFVAGASVLVRQALQFVGAAEINQDRIESILRQTADVVFDAATHANYSSVKVSRALESILVDDYGSTPSTALDITRRPQLAGALSRLDDADYFQFTAAASGIAVIHLDSPEALQATWTCDASADPIERSGTRLSFRVVAGQRYAFGLSGDQLAHYQLRWELAAARDDLGVVDFRGLSRQTIDGDRWYDAVAARDGWFTVTATADSGGPLGQIELFDRVGRRLAASSADGRVDARVQAGDRLSIRVSGAANYDLRLANLVADASDGLLVSGTAGDDVFDCSAGDDADFTVNGIAYHLSNPRQLIRFSGDGGRDAVTLRGTAGRDQAVLRAGAAELSGRNYAVQVADAESIVIFGRGGRDSATFFDSAGDDLFGASPTIAMLYGPGFYNSTRDFDQVAALHTAGGRDAARLHDSPGDDLFGADFDNAMLYGAGFYYNVQNFASVVGIASTGRDLAVLADSAGDDRLNAAPNRAALSGDGFVNEVQQFDRVTSRASAGRDTAMLYDSAADDLFTAGPTGATLAGALYEVSAMNFDWVEAHASTGFDRALFRDSAGNDTFGADAAIAMLYGPGYYCRGDGFEQVEADSTSGADVAFLYDTGGDDTLLAHGGLARMLSPHTQSAARGFAKVVAKLSSGTNLIDRSATDFVLSVIGGQPS